MARNHDMEDTLSLSFADVLTGVLGASIALFIIFVVLAKMEESDSTSYGDNRSLADSIQEKYNQGQVIATLRIMSDDRSLLEALKIDGVEFETYSITNHSGKTGFGNIYIFKINEAMVTVFLRNSIGIIGKRLDVQLGVGGLRPKEFTVTIASKHLKGSKEIFLIGKRFEDYIETL